MFDKDFSILLKDDVKKKDSLPPGFEEEGLTLADEPDNDDADDVINLPEDPKQTDVPMIDNDNDVQGDDHDGDNGGTTALAPTLTIVFVAILIAAAFVFRSIKRKKKLKVAEEEAAKKVEEVTKSEEGLNNNNIHKIDKEIENQHIISDNESKFGSEDNSIRRIERIETPPPIYSFLPRSSSLKSTHSLQEINEPIKSPQMNEPLTPPQKPFVSAKRSSQVGVGPIMPRSSSLNSIRSPSPLTPEPVSIPSPPPSVSPAVRHRD